MSNYAFSSIDELGEGPGFRKVRTALGVEAFGVNAVVYPPRFEGFPHYHDDAGRALLRPQRPRARRGRRRDPRARAGRSLPLPVDHAAQALERGRRGPRAADRRRQGRLRRPRRPHRRSGRAAAPDRVRALAQAAGEAGGDRAPTGSRRRRRPGRPRARLRAGASPAKRWLGKSFLPPGRGKRRTCSASGTALANAPTVAGSSGPREIAERDDAADARPELELAPADVLVRHPVAGDVEERPDERAQRGASRAARRPSAPVATCSEEIIATAIMDVVATLATELVPLYEELADPELVETWSKAVFRRPERGKLVGVAGRAQARRLREARRDGRAAGGDAQRPARRLAARAAHAPRRGAARHRRGRRERRLARAPHEEGALARHARQAVAAGTSEAAWPAHDRSPDLPAAARRSGGGAAVRGHRRDRRQAAPGAALRRAPAAPADLDAAPGRCASSTRAAARRT